MNKTKSLPYPPRSADASASDRLARRACMGVPRQHFIAQVISGDGSQVLASASSTEKGSARAVEDKRQQGCRKTVIARFGEGRKPPASAIVTFDRSGYQYHGRVKALAEAARASVSKF